MLLAFCYHPSAVFIEDDHLELVGTQQLESEEVSDLDLVNSGKGTPTLIKGYPTVDHPDRHPQDPASVGLQLEFPRDEGEVLGEVQWYRQARQLWCKDDIAEVSWPSLLIETAKVPCPLGGAREIQHLLALLFGRHHLLALGVLRRSVVDLHYEHHE